jgi:hypothetical protein
VLRSRDALAADPAPDRLVAHSDAVSGLAPRQRHRRGRDEGAVGDGCPWW